MQYFLPTTSLDFFVYFKLKGFSVCLYLSGAASPSPQAGLRSGNKSRLGREKQLCAACRSVQTPSVFLQMPENTFLQHSAGWEGWPTLSGGWQSTWQGIKGWERTTVLGSRQLCATLESDLAPKTESLWEGGTSPKPNVLQAAAICTFLFLSTSDLRPSHTISGRFPQSLWRGQWETSFQQITRALVVKSSPAFVFGADYSYSLCTHNRAGEQTVNKDRGHTLHKETAIKWWRTLLSLKL